MHFCFLVLTDMLRIGTFDPGNQNTWKDQVLKANLDGMHVIISNGLNFEIKWFNWVSE